MTVGFTQQGTATRAGVSARRWMEAGTHRILWAMLLLALAGPTRAAEPIPSLYREPAVFADAIAKEKPAGPDDGRPVTGITVPHHLLAADLIARGIWAASGRRYDRIVLVSPDHFGRSRKPFATTLRDFDTVFGPVGNDREASRALLADPDLVEENDALFAGEHGIAAVLPFLRRLVPDVPVVPLAISIRADPAEWERAAARLDELVGPGTLLVQSTDFSHYLSATESALRDGESLHAIASADPDFVKRLISSDHMDSRAAQFIQMRLQAKRGSHPVVLANRNSIEYAPHASQLTSYVVLAYSPERSAWPRAYPEVDVTMFGGDLFAGRFLLRPLAEPKVSDAIVRTVTRLTGGAPLVVNLEGTVLGEPPEGLPDHLHAMPAGLALPLLKALNVRAASLANNHSHDLGREGFRETIMRLEGAGIVPLRHGMPTDLGPLRVVALNTVGRNDRVGFPVASAAEIEALCRAKLRPPLVAFVHWGTEYAAGIGDAEERLARDLARCGTVAVVGAHSHRASAAVEPRAGGGYAIVPSLGNLLFDQTAARGSGALLEIRRFRQGTIALRLLPLPNLFDLGNALGRRDTGPAVTD